MEGKTAMRQRTCKTHTHTHKNEQKEMEATNNPEVAKQTKQKQELNSICNVVPILKKHLDFPC